MDREDKLHDRFYLENDPEDSVMPDDEQLLRLAEIVKEDPFAKFFDDESGDAVEHRDISAKRLSENSINEKLRPSNDPLPEQQDDILAKTGNAWRNQGDDGMGQHEPLLDSHLFSDGNQSGMDREHISVDIRKGLQYTTNDGACNETRSHYSRGFFILGISLCLVAVGAVIYYSPWNNIDQRIEAIPIIQADIQPVKTTPVEPGGVEVPNQNKLVYNLVSGNQPAAKEKLVPREEQVIDTPVFATVSHIDMNDPKYAGFAGKSLPKSDNTVAARSHAANNGQEQSPATNKQAENQPESYGSMPVPRKVQAVVINRNNSGMANVQPYKQSTAEVPLPSFQTKEYASVAPSTKLSTAVGTVGFVVQLAARRSEQMVINAYSEMQAHYPSLRSYDPLIQQVDLGEQGRYYRLRVGPLETSLEAEQLCAILRDEGLNDCLVRSLRNG